jgi:hypothetical protein
MIEDKFRRNSEYRISVKNMDNIIATVENFEKIDDVSALIALLQKSKPLRIIVAAQHS